MGNTEKPKGRPDAEGLVVRGTVPFTVSRTTSELLDGAITRHIRGVVAERMAEAHSEFIQKALGLPIGPPQGDVQENEATRLRLHCSAPPEFTEVPAPDFEIVGTDHSSILSLVRNWAREIQAPEPLYLTDEVADLILEKTGRDLHGVQITGVSMGGSNPLSSKISDEIIFSIDFTHVTDGEDNVLNHTGSSKVDPIS